MTDEPPSDYEQLPPDRAAHIDAVCDCFEQEWKASRTKGVRPSMTHYRELCAGPEREVLLRELAAIDRVYRRRYGSSDGQGSDSAPNGLTLAEARVGDSSSPDGSPASVVLAAASSPQAVPSTIGRFTLQRELGRGGMGVVYLAWDPELRREVAIKVLRGHGLSDPQARARFQTEARAAALLHHPNVVPVHEIGQDGSTSFIVLAYCPGVNLADWLQHQSEPVPHSDAAQLVATLADAVEFAHRHGVVHRDLKPANVLLELRGVDCELRNESRPQSANCNLQSAIPKITDFGLAKHIDEVAAQTQTGTAIGTPCYMAPEQTGTRSSATGPLTDVYALGGLLYELLTRRVPFQGETALDTLDQVRNREPIPPRQLRPRLPRDLETICLKCLEKEPRRRYASAHALAEELGRFLKGHPIHARPVSSWGRAVKWARCRPAVATLVASLGLVTLAGFVAVFGKYREVQFESGEKQKALELANQERQNALTAAAQAKADQLRAEAAHYGLQATLVQREWTHDNMQGARDYLAATDPALRSWEYGYLRRLCDPATLTLEGLDRPRRVAGSANGKWVAAFGTSRSDSPSGAIVVWDAVSGKQVQTFDNLPNPSYPLNFSSKGELILHGNRKDIVDAPNALAFSPDSKWLGAACTPEMVVHI
jgi:tRNA A-37 threonylcarbamoyl transferase component Bud32